MIKKFSKINLLVFFILVVYATSVFPIFAKSVGPGEKKSNGGPGDQKLNLASLEEAMKNFRKAREEFFEAKKQMFVEIAPLPQAVLPPRQIESQDIAPTAQKNLEPTRLTKDEIMLKIQREQLRLLQNAMEVLLEREKKIAERAAKPESVLRQKQLLPTVTNQISNLENLKKEISATDSPETVKALTEKIKNERRDKKFDEVKKSVILPYLEKFEFEAIKTAEARALKIEIILKELEASGKNIETLKIMLFEAKASIEAAKAVLAEAKDNPLKPTLESNLEKIKNHIKIAYKIFADIAILGKSL